MITDLKQKILFIADAGTEEEVVTRLARVGYDFAIGYLDGGVQAWKAAGFETDKVEEVEGYVYATTYKDHDTNLLDVRRASEFDAQHVRGALNFPLDFINKNMAQLDRNRKYYVQCASGYRSVIAISILKARGFEQLVNVRGGINELALTDIPMTEFVEQSTEL